MNACPSRADLQDLLANRLSPEQERPLLAHVETCPACQGTLEELTADYAGASAATAAGHGLGSPEVPSLADDSFWRKMKSAVPRWASTAPLGATDAPATGTDAAAATFPARLGRYELLEEIGRGGMGAVLRAHDPDLGRDLAVKVLRPDQQHDPAIVRRFTEEAQVGGQLQHPGIVPVYEVGRAADQRPYFAMKLVRGRTLQALLKERAHPANDLPHFLGIFGQVCQTLAYAHSKGVLHRDLKPANVMVGAFGEVQVMDWGLAKVLRPGGPPAPDGAATADNAIRTVRSTAAGTDSHRGQALGTPAYMAPEQARGEVDRLDERADVFGLGAMLCEILTGRPPGGADGGHALLARALGEDLEATWARLECCGAEAELVQLARACLAAEPAGRPRDAGVVAAALTAYQDSVAERLRQAELARAQAQVQAREERKRWRLTAALAAAGLALVLMAAGGGLWLQGVWAERRAEAARHEQALRQDVETALTQAVSFRQGFHYRQGHELLEGARQRLGVQGPDDLRQRVEQALADLRLAERFDAARLQAATVVKGHLDVPGGEQQYAAAFAEARLGREGDDAKAVAARVRDSAVRAEIVAALDDWAGITTDQSRRKWLLAVACESDPDPRRVRLRQPLLWQDRAALTKLAQEVKETLAHEGAEAALSSQFAAALGRCLRQYGGDAVPLLAAAQARFPKDFWLNFELAVALNKARRWEEAVGYYRAALARRPEASAVHVNLGHALKYLGRLDDAIVHYQEAVRLDPEFAQAHNDLGAALIEKGRLDEALKHCEQAVRLDPTYSKAQYNLGLALFNKGHLDKASARYQQALDLDRANPGAHVGLGRVLYARGRPDEAIAHYHQALRIDPKYVMAHNNLGNALCAKGRLEEAIAHYHQALRIDPKNALPHIGLGDALGAKGRLDEASYYFQQALELLPPADPLRAAVTRRRQLTQQLLALEGRLPAVLQGQDKPADAAEGFRFAELCSLKKQYAAAARLYADAFAADPRSADDLQAGHRYNAACFAAQAAAGQGTDATTVDGKRRTDLRRQALDWLRADLGVWAKVPDRALVQRKLKHWQQDSDLASVREPDGLAKLPASERQAWTKFWSDVANLFQKNSGRE
jgi:serine/threonine-protein kinase